MSENKFTSGPTRQVSTFAAQMDDKSQSEPDPVRAMTMRVASDMMTLLPRHASTGGDLTTLMRAMPNICTSLIETVAATAYRGDMVKARRATISILEYALKQYTSDDGERVHVVKAN